MISRMQALQKAVQEAGEKSKVAAERTSWFAVGTVIVSGLMALLAQSLLMWHQRRQTADQARKEISNSFAQWQLKQLCELYGPLRALLGQSNVLYRQMNALVIKNAPVAQFRLADRPAGDFDNKVFEVLIDGEWTHFRTVKHLERVYGQGLGVEPIFDAVAEVADRIALLIQERAGYVRQDQDKLIEVLGKYLAHYVTLKEVHKRARQPAPNAARYVNDDAVFPTEIQGLVDEGFRKLNAELAGWRSRGEPAIAASAGSR
ncbi:MAG TPA: hypothetical protein VLA61_26755 [Ideonella sp.]|uniref:hypothetical protein n=1 Tax=Ideonella sp. TaxID=1929293 RepID=UPI002C072897|nr:hypothetical protein [Ideonella sp.]HSI51884.1 hypothetical protein [Ideonella sp.]